MALEIERKYLDVDFGLLRPLLEKLGASCLGIHFETNILYDNPNGDCEKGDRVIRLRINENRFGKRGVFTLKWPVPARESQEKALKIREELETEVADPEIMDAMLNKLGYKAVLSYEKVRESWHWIHGEGAEAEEVKVDLDRLPFCTAVEVEASPLAINRLSRLLHLDKFKISTTSYTRLYKEWLSNPPGDKVINLTFDDSVRKALRQSLGLE